MSIKPLLDPNSADNKSLNLYCNSITTSGGSEDTVIVEHKNPEVYFLNPTNGGATILSDLKQLVNKNNNYITISGEVQITAGTNANGEERFFLKFDYPDLVANESIDFRAYINGSASDNTTTNRNMWLLHSVSYTPTHFILRFQPTKGEPIATVPQNLNFSYSFSYKTL